MVHVRLNVDPALNVDVSGVSAVVGGQIAPAQCVELRIIEPWIAEPLLVEVMDVSVDHVATPWSTSHA